VASVFVCTGATLEQVTYQKFSGRDGWEERGVKGANNCLLTSFHGLHAGLCHQGQRPKTVEATMPHA
jgi:hypothetical protein